MKYRIKQVGDTFYTQKKFLGIWFDCYGDMGINYFDSMNEARKILDDWAKWDERKTTIHNYP